MANVNSPYSPNLQNRYTNTQRSRHTKFDLGMMRDVASWELPEGACYDTVDTLCDYVGKIRKRGGTTSPAAGNSAATVEHLLGFKSNGTDALTGVWGSLGKAGTTIVSFNTSTGAATTVLTDGSAAVFAARPFQHQNLMVFSFQALGTTTNDRSRTYFAGGSTVAGTGSTNCTMAAGSNVVTGLAAVTSGMVGGLFTVWNVAGNNFYTGRVTAFISATSVRVEPTPTIGVAPGNDWQIVPAHYPNFGGLATMGVNDITGRYGASFQGRIVLGYTLRNNPGALFSVTGLEVQPNRVAWSQLPTEAAPSGGGLGTLDGNPFLYPTALLGSATFPSFNWVDIPGLGGMTGLAAVGDGQLMVFGPQTIFRISGQLTTETVANNSLAFSVDQVSYNVGCIAAKSIQYSQSGLIWAGLDNIYQYDGSQLKPLLQGRNARYFQDRLRAGNTIHGSAYAKNRNHYLLSMSGADSALMLNLDTLALTRTTNVDLFDSTPDPVDATKLWGARWWDTTGAAPTMTKGQLIGLESIWLPTSANKSDADGTAVLSLTKTAAYVNGALASNKMTADLNITADLRGSGSPTATVKADTKLNTSDASFVTLGTVPAGTAAGSKSFPVGYLVPEGPAIEIQFGNDQACDSCELLGLDFGTQGRPEEFST